MKAQPVARLLLGTFLSWAAPVPAHAQSALAGKPGPPTAGKAAPALAKSLKEAHPAWVRKADKGFFDDPLALHPSLDLLALIRTDTASFASLELFDLNKKTKVAGFPLGDSQQTFEHIVFTGADRSLVIVVKDSKTGQRTAQRFDNEGKPAGLLGPATDLGFASRGDSRYLVRWDQSQDKKASRQITVSVHDLKDFAPVGRSRVFPMDASGALTKPPLKVLAWLDGYTRIFGQEPSAFDKAKDVQVRDRAVLYDVLRGEFLVRQDINDAAAWEAVNQLRRRRPGRTAFAHIPEDQASLQLVDGLGAHSPLELAMPFESYDLASLLEQETGEQQLYFSLTVDPLNPEALTKKKADLPKLDLYRVSLPQLGALRDAAARTAEHLLRAPMDERPVKWAVSGGWVALLRKFKNFARGGEVLEVYRLP